MLVSMDDVVMLRCEVNGGYVTRGELLDHGWTDEALRRAVRDGVLVKVRHGCYAPSALVDSWTPLERYQVLCRAVIDRLGDGYALSHHSALAIWGGDLWGLPLNEVHVVRFGRGSGRRRSGVVVHREDGVEDHVIEVGGRRVVGPLRAAIQCAGITSIESGLVAVNSVLHRARSSGSGPDRSALLHEALDSAPRPGLRQARLVIGLSDDGCESVGESRSMYLFWRHRLPRPSTQREIRDQTGRLIGRSDFCWDDDHLGEFDGQVKYGRLLRPGETASDILVAEKVREDRMRDQGFGMSRWIWSDLAPPCAAKTAARIAAALERTRLRRRAVG